MEEHSRARPRVNYSAHALVKSSTKEMIRGKLCDIATDSLYLQIEPIFEIDEKVKVEIIVLAADSELSIEVSAKVVRKDENGIALHFISHLEWWPIFALFPNYSLNNDKILSDD